MNSYLTWNRIPTSTREQHYVQHALISTTIPMSPLSAVFRTLNFTLLLDKIWAFESPRRFPWGLLFYILISDLESSSQGLFFHSLSKVASLPFHIFYQAILLNFFHSIQWRLYCSLSFSNRTKFHKGKDLFCIVLYLYNLK